MHSRIGDDLKKTLSDLIAERLADGIDAEVRVTSIEVSENRLEIMIEVEISTVAEPDEVAERYFGLTGRVRDALGEGWRDFYPVITPTFSSEVHA
jgi:hypothetical protein